MSANNRASLITKLASALKKHYKPSPPQPARPLLEHVLYASLLQDAPAELADEGMAKCEQDFFDWNEVRVTTVSELSQVLSRLPDPIKAATRLKGNLQCIFEEFYTFDLDHLKKENLGKAVAKFEKMSSMTPFVLSYTIQHGLGGHSIPIDYSAMVILMVTEIASQPEAAGGKVPGLERAIPKSKGIEFSDLLHQAAVSLNNSAKDKKARTLVDDVAKGSSKRLDEWLSSKKAAKKRVADRKAAALASDEDDDEQIITTEKVEAKTPKGTKKSAKDQASTTESVDTENKDQTSTTKSKKSDVKKSAEEKSTSTPAPKKKTTKKKTARSLEKSTPVKPADTKKKTTKKPVVAAAKPAKKSTNQKLTKRKPR